MSLQKPGEREEEYFARLEFERKKKAAEEAQWRLAEEERRRLKELHSMRCPKCGSELVAIEYQGIEVDKCTACEGIWLDCGELEQVASKEGGFLASLLRIFR
ncbi:MAG: zf-TFIIB domain-containing protein [candidate division NC10 bacterium]|nr:zf-TFIIB domain-containing protein [candidate division NC10 bacterium]